MKITSALVALGLVGLAVSPALAQTGTTVIVPAPAPAPAASPPTTVTPPSSGTTTIVVPQGSSVTVTPPAAQTGPAAVAVRPWCAGSYAVPGGTNFGGCPGWVTR
jgi:hypothetical protein